MPSGGAALRPPLCHVIVVLMMTSCLVPRGECLTREYLAIYGTSVYIRCHDPTTTTTDNSPNWFYTYRQWILPSGGILSADLPLIDDDDTTKYSLTQNGSILNIHRVDKTDFGVYHCLVFPNASTSSILHVMQYALNINYQPESGQLLLTKYTSNIQYGVMAAFVVLVVMALVCFNYDQHQERFDITPPWLCESWAVVQQQQRKDISTEGQELKSLSDCDDTLSHANQGFQGKDEISTDDLDDANPSHNKAQTHL